MLARLDVIARAQGLERPSAVAEVLMPRSVLTAAEPADRAIAKGWRLYGRGRRRGVKFSGWRDTYFERLTGTVTLKDGDQEQIKANRLLEIVQKLNHWTKDISAALYAHTDHARDTLRTRGSPCLQYIQFEPCADGSLNMFALYRSHDYANKALGNFVGLGRALRFVAAHSGRRAGALTVFSIHPTTGAKAKLTSYKNAVAAIL